MNTEAARIPNGTRVTFQGGALTGTRVTFQDGALTGTITGQHPDGRYIISPDYNPGMPELVPARHVRVAD
jgi:hypothetical protein